jgi:hypothetical protein
MLRIDSHIDQVNAKTLQCNGKADVGIPYAEQRSQSSNLNKLNEGRHSQTHKAKTTNVHPSSTTTPSYRNSNSTCSNNVNFEGVKASTTRTLPKRNDARSRSRLASPSRSRFDSLSNRRQQKYITHKFNEIACVPGTVHPKQAKVVIIGRCHLLSITQPKHKTGTATLPTSTLHISAGMHVVSSNVEFEGV